MKNEHEFTQALAKLCKKHKLKNCIFAGTDADNKLRSWFAIEKMHALPIGVTQKDVLECGLNSARVYQAAREKIMSSMDQMISG